VCAKIHDRYAGKQPQRVESDRSTRRMIRQRSSMNQGIGLCANFLCDGVDVGIGVNHSNAFGLLAGQRQIALPDGFMKGDRFTIEAVDVATP